MLCFTIRNIRSYESENMNIEFDLNKLTEQGRSLLLLRANEWGCTPAEALARILHEAAKRAKLPTPQGKEAA